MTLLLKVNFNNYLHCTNKMCATLCSRKWALPINVRYISIVSNGCFVYDIIYEWIFALPKYFKTLSIILLFLLTSLTHRLWSIEHKKSVRAFNLYGYNTYEIVTFTKLADCWLLADGARRYTAQGASSSTRLLVHGCWRGTASFLFIAYTEWIFLSQWRSTSLSFSSVIQ